MDRKQEAIEEIGRIITSWIGAGPNTILFAQSREAIYDRLFSLMGISPKEMRKMLNAAWAEGFHRARVIMPGYFKRSPYSESSPRQNARYRDVSKILKEFKKKEQP